MSTINHSTPLFLRFGVMAAVLAMAFSASAQTEDSDTQAAAIPAGPNTSTAADFYVATNGNDAAPGTLAQPFRTVDRARLAVEALKPHVSGRTITVLIRNGAYYLPSTWTFTQNDSGTATTPILYANYPGETPVISGGQHLTNWKQATSTSWQTTLPVGTYFTQLWVNGARRYRPRTTPSGYLQITGEYSTTGSTTTVNELSYKNVAGGVPAKMANLADVELITFQAWSVPHLRVASVNTTTQRIVSTGTLDRDSFFHGFIPGHPFLLENVKEALKVAGQFYLDRPTGVLTYLPKSGETLTNTTIVAPHLAKILTASNLKYVTFQGLTFANSDWQVPKGGYYSGQADNGTPAGLTLTNSTGVVFESDTVAHTGGYGIEFLGTGTVAGGPQYLVQFKDGLITDTGAGGIRVGGMGGVCSGSGAHTDQNVPQHIYIGNNLITGGGRIATVGFAILVGDAHHVLIEHNEISDFYNTGVGVGFNWGYTCNFAHDDVVQYNHIYNLGQGVTSDLGGVYYLSGINTGNKMLNNKVHDIVHMPGSYGGWGLYVDAGAAGVLVENNLVYRTTDASFHDNSWGGAPPNPPPPPDQFINNILAYGAMGIMDRHNDTTFLNIVLERNLFYYDKGAILYGYWYCEGKTICTDYFQLNDNIYYDKAVAGGEPSQPFFKTPKFPMNGGQQPPITKLTFQQWQAQGEDRGSLFVNPLFVNPTPGVDNYTLQSNSPAHSVGFVPFNPALAGRLSTATLKAPVNAPGYPPVTTPYSTF